MRQPNAPRILALIPAYNEARRIVPVITGARVHLPVLVVDDGSTDETAVIAHNAGAQVLTQMPNQGKGAALQAGFRWALEQGYTAVLTLDADGQHDPAEIPRFLALYDLEMPDLIIGARTFRQMPPVRRLANWLGTRSFSWAIGQLIPDNQSGYRLIGSRLLTAMLESGESGFEFEVEMIVTAVKRGFTLAWVPIQTIYRDEPSHIRPWQHVTNFIRIVYRTRQTMRRR